MENMNLYRKAIVFTVIGLFIGVAVAPCMNADVDKTFDSDS